MSVLLRLPALSVVAFASLILLLAACGSSTTAAPSATATSSAPSTPTAPAATASDLSSLPSVTVTGTDYSYQMPKTIPSGMVAFTFVDKGAQPHQLSIGQLKPGVQPDQVMKAAQGGSIPALEPLVSLVGGINSLTAKSGSQQVILNITPGQYAAICFVSDKDGVPHFQKGMIDMFTAVKMDKNSTTEPVADTTAKLADFSITMPQAVHQKTLLKVTNEGSEDHELTILKPLPGKSTKDVVNAVIVNGPEGPTNAVSVPMGGMGALGPGKTAWFLLNLPPGDYVATCYVGDPKSQKAHSMLGMETAFTVQA